MRERIPVAEPIIDEMEVELVTRAIKSGWISTGEYVGLFEEKFARFCDSRFGVSVCNGTAALQLALAALRIGRGDEVIVPDLTFTATADVVLHQKAKLVLIDADPQTWNIDPGKIEEKITKRTRVIIPVHLYGHPADMDPILAIAKRHNLLVIEDAAEAHGALYKGKKVGSIGDIGCFSFFGNKIITTGEGGMLLTDDEDVASRASFLRNQAQSKSAKYFHPDLGFNFRMTNLQAAFGVAQMGKMERIIERKREIAGIYNKFLADVRELTLPPEMPWARPVYWMYSVLVEGDRKRRDKVIQKLDEKGIETRPFFHPIHTMPMRKTRGRFPVARDLSARGINFPSSANLTQEEIEYVVDNLRKVLENA